MIEIKREAERIERLLPQVMRALYRTDHTDPLHQLPLAQLRFVRALAAGERTPSELAQEFRISLSSVTQISGRLEEAGIVERVVDEEDRRVRHLTLTKQGLRLITERNQSRIDRLTQALATMTDDERCAVITSLERLISAGNEVFKDESDSLELVSLMEETP